MKRRQFIKSIVTGAAVAGAASVAMGAVPEKEFASGGTLRLHNGETYLVHPNGDQSRFCSAKGRLEIRASRNGDITFHVRERFAG